MTTGNAPVQGKRDTWTRRAARWICGCGQINPEITSKCLRCGQ